MFQVLHSIFCLQFEKYKFIIKLSETEEILPIKKKSEANRVFKTKDPEKT